MSEYRLVQVSDLHLAADAAHHYDNWQLVTAWIEREKPDMVVVNGDLVMENPDIEADHAFARNEIGRLTVPTRYLPGNHDIGDNVLFGKMAQRVNDVAVGIQATLCEYIRRSFSLAGWLKSRARRCRRWVNAEIDPTSRHSFCSAVGQCRPNSIFGTCATTVHACARRLA